MYSVARLGGALSALDFAAFGSGLALRSDQGHVESVEDGRDGVSESFGAKKCAGTI